MLLRSPRQLERRRRSSLRPLLQPLMQIFVLSLVVAAPARAQVVIGRVVGDSVSEPLSGAVVILMTEGGQRVKGVLTDEHGGFVIPAPAAGSYRLHAEMLGRRTTDSHPFMVGEKPVVVTLALERDPVRLEGVVVKAESRCATGPDVGEATLRVWEEVKKALRAETVTRELGMYEFDIKHTRRLVDPSTFRLIDRAVTEGKSVAQSPFRTLSPSEIAEHGYARTEGSQVVIYGPDIPVLLSPGFESTHCFSLKEKKDRIGLVFKPVKGRRVTDIEGVIWVDRANAELQRIDFDYKRIPYDLVAGRYSGFLEFQRMECGAWIIEHWRLNTPASMAEAEVTGLQPLRTAEAEIRPADEPTQGAPPAGASTASVAEGAPGAPGASVTEGTPDAPAASVAEGAPAAPAATTTVAEKAGPPPAAPR